MEITWKSLRFHNITAQINHWDFTSEHHSSKKSIHEIKPPFLNGAGPHIPWLFIAIARLGAAGRSWWFDLLHPPSVLLGRQISWHSELVIFDLFHLGKKLFTRYIQLYPVTSNYPGRITNSIYEKIAICIAEIPSRSFQSSSRCIAAFMKLDTKSLEVEAARPAVRLGAVLLHVKTTLVRWNFKVATFWERNFSAFFLERCRFRYVHL